MVKQYGDLYLDTRRELLVNEDAQMAGFMARNLLCHVSGLSQETILSQRDKYAPESVVRGVEAGLKRLLEGEPLAYVLGEWEFYGLKLAVTPDVLIPRDDTCAVTALAINKALFLDQDPRVLDLCCGSGCIGLAVAIAKKNCAQNKLSGRVRCVQVNALEQPPTFLGKFDLIVSNPPYITGADMLDLPVSVKNYEPHMALFGGEDGLDFYRAIAKNYTSALKPGGYLCFEFGDEQGDDVCRILEENGYTILERSRDYNDRERAVLAQYGRKEA